MSYAGPLLEVQDLEVQFPTSRGVARAVNGVSFAVGRGETLGIVGETGSGKSVTAFALLRLVSPPGRITAGEIRFEGRSLLGLPEREMRRLRGRDLSMIFQEVMTSLDPSYTVGDQIREVLHVHRGLRGRVAAEAAVELLTRVRVAGPETVVARFPHQLSGGMRQRVMIAMALACQPKLLIADEPTTALDTTIQAQILDLLDDIQDELGMGMVFISHDLGVVTRVSDRVAVMYLGRILEMGHRRQIFNQTLHPYTRGLLEAIPRADARHEPLRPVRGAVPSILDLPSGCPFHPRCPRAESRCEVDAPALREYAPGHLAACHFAGDFQPAASAEAVA